MTDGVPGESLLDLEPAEVLSINSLEALKVMADPLRAQIVDALRRAPGTAKGLARTIGVAPRSLYYHLGLLEKHGMIRVVGTRLVSGIVEKTYRATAYLFEFGDLAAPPGVGPSARRLDEIGTLFTITREEIRVALESGLVDPDACLEEGGMASAWALIDLTPADAERLAGRLEDLFNEFGHLPSGPETRPYRFLFDLFPTYRRGRRPDSEEKQ